MKKVAEVKKRNEDKERRKFKEIDPSLVVRTTKFLGRLGQLAVAT